MNKRKPIIHSEVKIPRRTTKPWQNPRQGVQCGQSGLRVFVGPYVTCKKCLNILAKEES